MAKSVRHQWNVAHLVNIIVPGLDRCLSARRSAAKLKRCGAAPSLDLRPSSVPTRDQSVRLFDMA
jgi:hypothetical protein